MNYNYDGKSKSAEVPKNSQHKKKPGEISHYHNVYPELIKNKSYNMNFKHKGMSCMPM